MMTKVFAHKGIGIECKLSGTGPITVPAGGVWEGNLTGDQVGKVEAYLEAQSRGLPTHLLGGGIKCAERDAAPPKGSKAWRLIEEAKKPKAVEPVKSKKDLAAEATVKAKAKAVTEA